MSRSVNSSVCWGSPGIRRRCSALHARKDRSRASQSMSFAAETQVLERIAAAPVLREPFAHCIIDDVFPADFYERIIDEWPQQQSWRPIEETGRVIGDKNSQRM